MRRIISPFGPYRGLACQPEDAWPGSLERGNGLIAQLLRVGDEWVPFTPGGWRREPSPAPTSSRAEPAPGQSIRPLVALHSFDWFRDLDACGDRQSHELMQRMTLDWLKSVPQFDEPTRSIAFRHDVIGQRLWVFLVWFRYLTFRHKTLGANPVAKHE